MSTAAEVLKAVAARYAALTFASKPALYQDAAPTKTAAGVAVSPPYVVLTADEGPGGEWMSESDRIEVVRLTFDIYAPTKAAARDVAAGLQYDGDTPFERHGMDDADSLTLPAGYVLNKLERQGPGKVLQDRKRGASAQLEYQLSLVYLCEIVVNGDGT